MGKNFGSNYVKWNRFFRSRAILARNELRAKIQNGGFSRDEIAEDFELLIENLEDNDDLAILSAVSCFFMWRDLNRIQGYFEINHSMLRANWRESRVEKKRVHI